MPASKKPPLTNSAKAFAPGHLTGFFIAEPSKPDPLWCGSRGAGLSLAKGVTTSVTILPESASFSPVLINGKETCEAVVTNTLLAFFKERVKLAQKCKIKVEHEIAIPIGAGFGSSGASALSLALALNEVFGRPLSKEETAQLAHLAELNCRTGLGTVLADTVGGLEIRIQAGAPGIGKVNAFPLPEGLRIGCFVFGPLSTPQALADKMTLQLLNALGEEKLAQLQANPTPANFIQLAAEFTQASGLLSPRLKNLLQALAREGIIASMAFFGEVAFFFYGENFPAPRFGLRKNAIEAGAKFYSFKAAAQGATIL